MRLRTTEFTIQEQLIQDRCHGTVQFVVNFFTTCKHPYSLIYSNRYHSEEKSSKKMEKAATKKEKTLKEKQIIEENKTEDVPAKKKKVPASKVSAGDDVVKPSKKKATKEDPLPEGENGTDAKKKTTRAKKTKPDEDEKPGPSKTTKTAAAKNNVKKQRGKKENDEEVVEEKIEEPSDAPEVPAKKAPKRKVAKAKTNKEPEEKKTKAAAPTRTNATVTDWECVDFNCTSKTPAGKPSNFHIVSWNVDGMRAWLKKGGLNILKYAQPDILCLQETKCSEDKVPEEMNEVEGYESYWCSSDKEGYAGVGVLTKTKPLNVVYGINSKELDDEGRCITLEFKEFYLVNVYVPNAGRKLVTLPKRLDWNTAFKAFIKKLDETKPVIVCGDMNVAHKEIDLSNPKTNTKNAGFTVEEREGMSDFLGEGYVDTFRELYPEKEKAYTFWTYMGGARTKNIGWRLDYFIVSERFTENVCDNMILQDVLGSDHCPIVLHVNI